MVAKVPSHVMQTKASVVRVEDLRISAMKTSTTTPWSTMTNQAMWKGADRNRETETRVERTSEIDPTLIVSKMALMKIKTRTIDTRASTPPNKEIIES